MKRSKSNLYDPVIVNRVRQYLEENVDKTYLDVAVMTKHLQDSYPEYARRKTSPFRMLVEQAYRILSHSYGLEDQGSSGDDSDASDLEVMDDTPNNPVSNMMSSLYSKPKPATSTSTVPGKAPGEAIDISSDESEDESYPSKPNGKSLNKAIASMPTVKTSPALVTKLPITTSEQPSKAPSSTASSNATDSNSSPLVKHEKQPSPGSKRRDNSNMGSGVSGNGGHPPKKQKNDNGANSFLMQQIQRHNQLRQQRENLNGQGSSFNHLGGAKRLKKYKKDVVLRKSRESFQSIGGMEKTLKELCEILMHIKAPDIYFTLGLMPPRGILLHGPPGCGKTLLAHAIAGQLNLALIEIPATELIAGVSGESEERIRDVFEQAVEYAPCVLFLDEIDAISSNRTTALKGMERRIVSQLISSLDNLKSTEGGQSVLVIGATTRPDILDPALRRVGRFDHEIAIGIPTRKDRKDILTIICEGLSVEPKCDFDKIAELTPGYVGADLLALVSRSATIAVKRKCSEQMRAFQLKAQSNITIVDLDDENDENEVKNEAEKNNSGTETVEKNDTKEDKPSESQAGDEPDTTNVAEKCAEKSAEPEEMEVDSEETAEKNSESLNTIKEKPEEATENLNEMKDDTASNDTAKVENIKKEKTAKVVKFSEPTLFELLNWLDNTPEDITVVSDFCITLDDFCEAVKVVQPSAKREGFITVPDVTWDDVGSLKDIREELKLAVLAPVKFPEKMAQLGLSAPSGVLLCGPPGCGKTLLAKAIANEAGINFISVKGPELMNMYVGESERAVRACFQRARNSAPCVIFFDEFDSLCPKRSDNNEGGSGTRVVNQLLTEMDGVEERQGVYILAATNRPDIIDPAILRPGRLDTVLYVGLPEENDRVEILKANTKDGTRPILANDVDFKHLASLTDGYTGADLAGLVRQASMLALKESINSNEIDMKDLCVTQAHFTNAIQMLRPSVSDQDRKVYDLLRRKYAAPRILMPDLKST